MKELKLSVSEEEHVALSFRQTAQCEGKDMEVESLNAANGGNYSVVLSGGSYKVVASSYGGATQEQNVDVSQDTSTEMGTLSF